KPVMSSYTVIRGARVLNAGMQAATVADDTLGLAAKLRGAPHADVLIESDTIREVGRPGLAAPADATVIDGKNRLLIPGLINAHTHSHANIPRSFGDRWTLELALNANSAIRGQPSVEEK